MAVKLKANALQLTWEKISSLDTLRVTHER